MIKAAGRLCAALALVVLLSGCIAAVAALPALAGGAVLGSATGVIRVATPRPKAARPAGKPAEQTAGAPDPAWAADGDLAAVSSPAVAGAPGRGPIAGLPSDTEVLAKLDPWHDFLAYASRVTDDPDGKGPSRSALLDPSGSLAVPKLRGCQTDSPAAVLIDLDAASARFDPRAVARPAPRSLSEGLAALREKGVIVAWITSAPASEVGAVGEALRASGLDPHGDDPLLLLRSPDDRKQALRQQANRDVCVVAVAGDRRGDFDELFDYLRDPASAAPLDSLLGQGWFLVPPPLG